MEHWLVVDLLWIGECCFHDAYRALFFSLCLTPYDTLCLTLLLALHHIEQSVMQLLGRRARTAAAAAAAAAWR